MSASDHFILLSAITLAYTVFGMTGFGAAMVAVPILVHILPLEFAVPLILLMDIVATVSVALKSRRHDSFADQVRLAADRAGRFRAGHERAEFFHAAGRSTADRLAMVRPGRYGGRYFQCPVRHRRACLYDVSGAPIT